MSKFNESAKSIISDVETFLTETLRSVSLPKYVSNEKDSILQKIEILRVECPNSLPPKDEGSGNTIGSVDSHDDPAYNDMPFLPAISAAEAGIGSMKSGFLNKRRKFGKTGELLLKINPYQKRWCAIKKNIFYYYEKDKDKAQKGAFNLTGYEFREAPFQVKEPSKKELSFQLLKLGDRTYDFLAMNKEDMQEWKAVVEKIAKDVPPTSPPSVEIIEDDDIYEPLDEYPRSPTSDETYDDGTHIDFRPSSVYDDAESPAVSTPVKPEEKLLPKMPRTLPPEPKQQKTVPDFSSWKLGILNDYGNMYYGKWDCLADADNELAFKQGDMIHVLSREFESRMWWVGEHEGKIGLVPKQYLLEAYEKVVG